MPCAPQRNAIARPGCGVCTRLLINRRLTRGRPPFPDVGRVCPTRYGYWQVDVARGFWQFDSQVRAIEEANVCVSGPCPHFYQRGRGYDINRYHSFLDEADIDPYVGGPNPVPEALAMRLLFDERQPLIVIDFHHQGSYVDPEGDLITGSTLWPNATSTAEALGVLDRFEQAVELAKQVVAVMVTELDPYGYANITRYPGTTTPGIARNAYGLLGAGSVLFEMRGGIGVKSNGYITQTAYNAAKAVVVALADGSLFDADIAIADSLPDRGPGIGAPNEDEEHTE
jgi:hypothetical protein